MSVSVALLAQKKTRTTSWTIANIRVGSSEAVISFRSPARFVVGLTTRPQAYSRNY